MNACKDHNGHVQTWNQLDPPGVPYHIQVLVWKRSDLHLGQSFSPWSSRQMTRSCLVSLFGQRKDHDIQR